MFRRKGMKKYCIVFGLLFIIILTAAFAAQEKTVQTEYLRMHVRANSDSATDQAVKYEVKDAIVDYLIPLAAECTTKREAMSMLKSELDAIEEIADGVLQKNGFAYTARASLRQEEFPTRVYEDVTLEAGIYDALIVELGEGVGANWWCVVYPPLCFAGEASGEGVIYRSRLWEIIRDFFAE